MIGPSAIVLSVWWGEEVDRRFICKRDATPVLHRPVAPRHGKLLPPASQRFRWFELMTRFDRFKPIKIVWYRWKVDSETGWPLVTNPKPVFCQLSSSHGRLDHDSHHLADGVLSDGARPVCRGLSLLRPDSQANGEKTHGHRFETTDHEPPATTLAALLQVGNLHSFTIPDTFSTRLGHHPGNDFCSPPDGPNQDNWIVTWLPVFRHPRRPQGPEPMEFSCYWALAGKNEDRSRAWHKLYDTLCHIITRTWVYQYCQHVTDAKYPAQSTRGGIKVNNSQVKMLKSRELKCQKNCKGRINLDLLERKCDTGSWSCIVLQSLLKSTTSLIKVLPKSLRSPGSQEDPKALEVVNRAISNFLLLPLWYLRYF